MDQPGEKTDFYEIRKEYPAEFRETACGYFAGFEKTAFGNIEVEIDAGEEEEAELLLGEMYDPFYRRINRRAPRYVRNVQVTFKVEKGKKTYAPSVTDLMRNHQHLPSPTGKDIIPFRYAELRCKGNVTERGIVRNSVFGRIPETAASFHCSNPMLDRAGKGIQNFPLRYPFLSKRTRHCSQLRGRHGQCAGHAHAFTGGRRARGVSGLEQQLRRP